MEGNILMMVVKSCYPLHFPKKTKITTTQFIIPTRIFTHTSSKIPVSLQLAIFNFPLPNFFFFLIRTKPSFRKQNFFASNLALKILWNSPAVFESFLAFTFDLILQRFYFLTLFVDKFQKKLSTKLRTFVQK